MRFSVTGEKTFLAKALHNTALKRAGMTMNGCQPQLSHDPNIVPKPIPNSLPFNLQPIGVLAWSPDGWRLAAQCAVKRADWSNARPAVTIWNARASE